MEGILIFLLTLSVLVLPHEFGHFIMAKKFGIKVLEFGLGLPPKIWSKKIGETIFSINWLPFGGFVRLLGEDEINKSLLENKRSFAAKSVFQRVGVVVSGVTMNILLALVLFAIVLSFLGFKEQIPLLRPYQFWAVEQQTKTSVVVSGVTKDSPAQKVGLKKGDQIVRVGQVEVGSSEELVGEIKKSAGEKIVLGVKTSGQEVAEIEIVPRVNPPRGEGALGVELVMFKVAELSYVTPLQKVFSPAIRAVNMVAYSFSLLGEMIGQSFTTGNFRALSSAVSGPVGVTNLAGDILKTRSPLIPYIDFIGLLSLNLAIVNILPIPALDGGRLLFLVIEGVFRKKIKAEIERWVHTVGMALLLALIILITFSDIRKLLF